MTSRAPSRGQGFGYPPSQSSAGRVDQPDPSLQIEIHAETLFVFVRPGLLASRPQFNHLGSHVAEPVIPGSPGA